MISSTTILILTSVCLCINGSDVILGILGTPAFIECQLPVSNTLVWRIQYGGIIAINGKVLNENSTKYLIQKQTGFRESLVIHDVTLADDKVYQCHDIMNKSAIDGTQLKVLVRPAYTNLTGPRLVQEGQEFTLVCEADGAKPLPDIRWFKQDADGNITEIVGSTIDYTYENGTGSRKSSLLATVTREMYMMTYICNVTVSVFYQQTMTYDLDILLAPLQPIIIGYDGSFDEGKLTTIDCTSTGSRPPASISWFIDGQPAGDTDLLVIPKANGTSTVRSTLSRKFTRYHDGSILTCAVTNAVIKDRRPPVLMTNVTLRASYRPNVTIAISNDTANEGDNVTLRCNVDANPSVDVIHWLLNGNGIDRRLYTTSNDSTYSLLSLKDIQRSNAGDYTCHTTNRLGPATSSPLHLAVQYKPVCASSHVLKYAVRIGQSTKINCHMMASPNDVMMTWKYTTRVAPITTTAATADTINNDHAYAILDIDIRSSQDYGIVICKGTNAVGPSSKPCRFEILPPSPPEPPSNCSVLTNGNIVNIHCEPSFNGGSVQHFLLQEMKNEKFETTDNARGADYRLNSPTNLTIRVCAVNQDFPDVQKCAPPLAVTVNLGDQPQSDPVVEKKSRRTAYIIAGSITATVGVVIISVLVVCLVRRHHKERTSREIAENDVLSGKNSGARKGKNAFATWFSIKFSSSERRKSTTTTENITATPNIQRNQIVTTDDNAAYQDVIVLSSTPHYGNRNRIDRNVILDINALKIDHTDHQLNDVENKPRAPDVLCESTGFVMSPISCKEPEKYRKVEESSTVEYLDETYSIPIDITNDNGLSNCYNTEDIIEGLDSRNSYSGTYSYSMSGDFNMKTIDKEYTDGDMDDILDGTTKNQYDCQIHAVDKPEHVDPHTVEIILIKTTDLDEVKDGERQAADHRVLLRSPLRLSSGNKSMTNVRDNQERQSERTLRKTFSLPCRSRRRLDNRQLNEINKIEDNKPVDVRLILNAAFQDLPESRSISIPKVDLANSFKTDSDLTSSACSEYTDAASTLCDIDEYTLTITSETGTDCDTNATIKDIPDEFANNSEDERMSELEWDSSMDRFIHLEYSGSFDNQSLYRKQRLRSDSFMEAVTGLNDPTQVGEQTDSTFKLEANLENEIVTCADSETESSYFNYGFEYERTAAKEVEAKASEHDTDQQSNGSNNNVDTHITESGELIDVVAFF